LETRLTKEQIIALWLDTVEMGRGPAGWMTGFFEASQAIYGRTPVELSRPQFIHLVAVLIAPASYSLTNADAKLDERARRIERLVAFECTPSGNSDVWLDGCGDASAR
jgi:membrane peptidoglycan carboxypeptidase